MAVNTLEDNNFQDTIQNENKAVVKFYADWCGTCKLMKPKYKRLSEEEDYSDVDFYEVNAEHNPEARKAAGVSNLPFFAIYKDGQLVEGVSAGKEQAIRDLINKLN